MKRVQKLHKEYLNVVTCNTPVLLQMHEELSSLTDGTLILCQHIWELQIFESGCK